MRRFGWPDAFDALPGAEIVGPGIADLHQGRVTVNAVAVLVAAPRLRDLGLDIPPPPDSTPSNHLLYGLLNDDDPDTAYARYKAILGRLMSFADAGDQWHRHERPQTSE